MKSWRPAELSEQMETSTITSLLRIDAQNEIGDSIVAYRQLAISAGFDGVEVVLDQELATTKVEAVFACCPLSQSDEVQRSTIILLKKAATMGVRCMNLTFTNPHLDNGDTEPSSPRDFTSLAYRLLHNIRFEAERFGVMIALEAGCQGHFLSPVELREVIDEVNSWAVGACVDMNRIAGFSDPADWIYTLGRRIHTIRFNDLAQQQDAPNGTALDFSAITTALNHISYNGFVIVGGTGSPEEIRNAMQLPLPSLYNRDNICVTQE